MGSRVRSVIRITGALSALVAAQYANAQAAAEAPTASAEANSGATIEEVVVSAQRRTENLQQTPLAVTALSPDELESRNIQTSQDLMQVTPSLQVSTQTAGNSGGSASFFLRGVGQQRSGNGSEPAVGIYVDDFYYPSLQASIFSVLDVSSIEVLRGPQGTLFGRNTIGGAIRYTSAKPSFTESSVHATATMGSYDRHDATFVGNLAINDTMAARLTVGRLRTEGYVKVQNGTQPDAGGTGTDVVRLQYLWKPSDAWTIDLSAQHSKATNDGSAYSLPQPIVPRPNTIPFAYNRTPAGLLNPYDSRYTSQCDYCQPGTRFRESTDNLYNNLTGTVTWDINDVLTLKSLSSWQQLNTTIVYDADATVLPVSETPYNHYATTAWSQEFQLNGKMFDERFNWIAGVFAYRELTNPDFTQTISIGTVRAGTKDVRLTKSYAGFVDGTFKLTDQLSVLGGVRVSKDDKQADLYTTANKNLLLAEKTPSFNSTTGRVGVQYQWDPTVMTYASVSKGFRGGGINQTQSQYYSFDPEEATSYEVGARLDLFDRRVRLNPTAFYTKWKDIQVQQVVVQNNLTYVFFENAARASSKGFELETEGAVTDKFRLFGNLAYLDLHYDSIGAATGITLNSLFERAPKWTYTVGARYQTKIFNGFTLRPTVNFNWQDKQNSTPTDVDALHLPSYGLLSARIELTDPNDKWTVALFGTNLTDKLYYVGGGDYSANFGAAKYDLGRPREYGVTLRFDF